jgi:integrase
MPMVILALNTGMRRGELFNLAWSDIDLGSKQLTVQGGGAKTGNTRYLPLNDEAFSTLVAWRNQTVGRGLVFPSHITGERLNNIDKAWTGLRKLANIENFRFHDLRHTFASKLVMAGVVLNTVRELLGHTSMEMTLRYAHLDDEHMANAVAELNQ